MRNYFQKRWLTFAFLTTTMAVITALVPFVTVSCKAQRAGRDEAAAVEELRSVTRSGGGRLLPAEGAAARLESEYAGTKTGALARVLRARVRLEARDFPGAAALLDHGDIARLTAIGDHALFMRGQALEQAGRQVEARAAYERLARDFPASIHLRASLLRNAELARHSAQTAAVPLLVKTLTDRDDPAALLLAAAAFEQQGDRTRALDFYRRLYFYAPAANESAEAATALRRLGSTASPATADEALARADRLFDAQLYPAAADAYAEAFARFAATAATLPAQLRRAVALSSARNVPAAIIALTAIPASAGDLRAESLYHLALTHARARQWPSARATADEMRRLFPQSPWTMRALVAAGQAARDAKNSIETNHFFRAAVSSFPGAAEVASAQFELAWLAHEAGNYHESARLLIEHLAQYAHLNTDNRGRAGYWAARDAERAGQINEARALYQALLVRYAANWYGYLARQRLDVMARRTAPSAAPTAFFAPDSPVGLAVAHLEPITIAAETAGPEADERITKADQLTAVGLDEWAHAELDEALADAPTSPRLNLAKARIFRAHDDNLQAFNLLRRSYPDYSQMKPEELTRDEWDVFYPLAHWDIIVAEARAKNLDPYTVAGLIRQESVFNPRAVSTARAYGLMQLLVPTGRLVAKRYDVERSITADALFEPRLNIQLGTGYLRENFDKFNRLEYVAAAYNAGPGRAVRWRETLPLEIDEWAEAIPFRETRGYVQGVVRNMLQYKRLYDEQGRFRPEVGARAERSRPAATTTKRDQFSAPLPTAGTDARPRRVKDVPDPDER